MLGRLRMSIEECEEKYDEISKKVFGSKAGWIIRDESTAFVGGTYLYDPKNLEDAIKKVVGDKLGDPLAPMLEENPKCKVSVVSNLHSLMVNLNSFLASSCRHLPARSKTRTRRSTCVTTRPMTPFHRNTSAGRSGKWLGQLLLRRSISLGSRRMVGTSSTEALAGTTRPMSASILQSI